MVRIEVDTSGDQCSIFERDDTGKIPVRGANILDQTITLQSNTLLGQLIPVAWVARMTQRRSSASDNSKLPEELKELLNRSSNGLSNCEVKELTQFFREFKECLVVRGQSLGRTFLVQHRINTGDTTPIRQPPRRHLSSKQKEMSWLVQDMLTEGVIEPSSSAWSSPLVLVAKKDGGLRFYVDYLRSNYVTKKECYPLPRVDDTLDTLSGAQWFSTLDLKSGY